MNLESTILEMAKAAREASTMMARCPTKKKNEVLLNIADTLENQAATIMEENRKDL